MTERSETPEWALQRIERARAEGSKTLVLDPNFALGGSPLEAVPPEVFSCPELEELYLDHNSLAVVPNLDRLEHLRAIHLFGNPLREVADQLGLVLDWQSYLELRPQLTAAHVYGIRCSGKKLVEALDELPHLGRLDLRSGAAIPSRLFSHTALQWLNLSDNQLSSLPESVSQLAHLRSLNLSSNQLRSLPESVVQLTHLQWLNLSFNQLRSLPESVGQLRNLRSLNLAFNQLSCLPESVGQLRNLQMLGLTSNQLTSLPESVGQLRNLQSLDPVNNQLMSLPESVGQLRNLQRLDLSSNQLTSLPESVGQLTNLQWLIVMSNQLTSLPESVGQLANLQLLGLSFNQLTSLPGSVGQLRNLQSLDLLFNRFRSLPESVGQLRNLESLNLEGNQLSSLPESVGQLTNLQSLNLQGNQLSSLPESVGQLTRLTTLQLSDNPIKVLPSWVVDLPQLSKLYAHCEQVENVPQELLISETRKELDLERLRAFFREAASEGLEVVCEAKLLIVGEGEAGKTSLLRKLLDPEAELTGGDEGTEGIDVQDWTIHEVVRGRDSGLEGVVQSHGLNESLLELTVHVWDFAGQEIAYPTHQFFLTKRSVYALVVSSRHSRDKLDYWLNVIKLLSDSSPVVLVDNQKGDHPSGADAGKIKAAFPNVKASCSTNLLTGRGLPETELALRAELRALPLIGQVMPKSWKRVRDALEAENANYITLKHCRELCDSHEFSGEERQDELLAFLHDLGVCLHFDTPGLSHWVILQPEWATTAVYRVMRDPQVTEAQGRFTRDDLKRIWHEVEYRDVRDALLELMTHFKLCYRLPVEEAYIIPRLLSESEPDITWDKSAELRLRYDYDFMPQGIMTALTVSVFPLIERQDWVWRHGGVFATEGARAWVHEEPGRGRLHLRVSGSHRKQLLGVLHHELSKIHARFHGLKVQRWIPCPCGECKDSSEPFRFDEAKARNAFKAGRELQCQVSYDMIAPSYLLELVGEDVRDPVHAKFDLVIPGASIAMTVDSGNDFGARDEVQERSEARRAGPTLEKVKPARRQVYISYKWGGKSEAMAEAVEAELEERGLPVIRDRPAMGYKDDIGEFMKILGEGHCVVAIISDGYLKSDKCMAELVRVGDKDDFWQRIFPITLADAAIYKPVRRVQYTKHWQQQLDELNQELDGTDKTSHSEALEELQRYREITQSVDRITKRLSDMNTLSPEEHRATNFEQLARAIQQRLGDVSWKRSAHSV